MVDHKSALVGALTAGAQDFHTKGAITNNFMARSMSCEYVLTTALFWRLVEKDEESDIEVLSRNCFTLFNSPREVVEDSRNTWGKSRFDLTYGGRYYPKGIIEVKSKVRTFQGIKSDIDRLMEAIGGFNRRPPVCVQVFEAFLSPQGSHRDEEYCEKKYAEILRAIEEDAREYLMGHDIVYSFVRLSEEVSPFFAQDEELVELGCSSHVSAIVIERARKVQVARAD